MPTARCPVCSKDFFAKAYRLNPDRSKFKNPPCCGYACSRELLKRSGFRPHHTPKNTKDEIRTRYESGSNRSVKEIAERFGVSRSVVMHWAKQEGWVRPKHRSTRATYRRIATEKIGRSLTQFEHVHHIDGNTDNNTHENLWVFPDAKAHSLAHSSLDKCAFALVSTGTIVFDTTTMTYRLADFIARLRG